jgi:hypothetical protein
MASDQTSTLGRVSSSVSSLPAISGTTLPVDQEGTHGPPESLPRIVTDCTDLVAIVRDYRKGLRLSQFETDMIAGNQDGYGSKLEGPGRQYGRRPTRLTYNLSVRFQRDTGDIVSVGASADTRAVGSPLTLITGPASWWLEAMGLALVLMPRKEAEGICDPSIPWQRRMPKVRSGRRVRRVSTAIEVSGIDMVPNPVAPVNPADLRECAKQMARAQRSGSVARISKAITRCRAVGIDPEALSQAVQMTGATALEMSSRQARTAAYLHMLNHPDVRVSQVDSVEHVRDMPPTEAEAWQRSRTAWVDLVGG